MEGYRNDAAATGEAFDVQGWLRTGDAGSIDDLGRVSVHGRLDDAIRTGAETVWPDEVERALADHPKIRDVAVAGRPHPGWGQQVVAFVVPRFDRRTRRTWRRSVRSWPTASRRSRHRAS